MFTERVNLLHGDCLDLMETLPLGSFDLILTDLPYGVTRNPWDSVLPLDRLWDLWHKVAKKDATFLLFGQGLFSATVMNSNRQEWRYNLIWDKQLPGGFLNAGRQPMRIHEDIMVFQRGKPVYNPQMGIGQPLHSRFRKGADRRPAKNTSSNYNGYTYESNEKAGSTEKYPVSIVSFAKPHPSQAVHPTEKPVNLLRWLIRTYSDEGMAVLDCCMGSGSTGVAAILEKRSFVGIEKETAYFETASRRAREAEAEAASRLF